MISVFELMSHLRVWPDWKIRIPIDTAAVYSSVERFARSVNHSYDVEVGYASNRKVSLTILADTSFSYGPQLINAIDTTARDGELAVLGPISAIRESNIIITMDKALRRPDIYVLPHRVARRTAAWFVYSRERTGVWRALS